MTSNKLVSIIIPTFNRAYLIGRTLDSVIAQTYNNWECIVVDDGSTDYTRELLEFYCEKDNRISFYKRPTIRVKGAGACRNYAFEVSKGDFIRYLDSGDLIASEKLKCQVNYLEKATVNTVVCCDWLLFKNNFKEDFSRIYNPVEEAVYKPLDFLEELGDENKFYPYHCYLTPRNLILKAGVWNEDLTNNDDAEFFTRVLLRASEIKISKDAHAYYRSSDGSNLSNYTGTDKLHSAVKSWILIESHLRNKFSASSFSYVENAKRQIFNTLKDKFPCSVAQNFDFFESQFKKEPYRLKSLFILKRSLKNYLSMMKFFVLKKLKNNS